MSEINLITIKKILSLLRQKSNYEISSNIHTQEQRSEKLINICKKLNSFNLMSNEGSVEYMNEDIDLFKSNQINLFFYKYNIINYNQIGQKFVPNLSIIDLLFNEGPNSLKIIISGLKRI